MSILALQKLENPPQNLPVQQERCLGEEWPALFFCINLFTCHQLLFHLLELPRIGLHSLLLYFLGRTWFLEHDPDSRQEEKLTGSWGILLRKAFKKVSSDTIQQEIFARPKKKKLWLKITSMFNSLIIRVFNSLIIRVISKKRWKMMYPKSKLWSTSQRIEKPLKLRMWKGVSL